jgi:hypothetical protein
MKQWKTYLLTALGIASISLVVLLIPQGARIVAATVPGPAVTVVNTGANPVPVNVGNTPSVKLDPSGNTVQGTVNLGNLPTDSAGSVKVAPQGTTTVQGNVGVSGTVSVGNLPVDGNGNLKTANQGTQDVNVTGGTLNAAPAVQKIGNENTINIPRGTEVAEDLSITGLTQISFVSVDAGSGNDVVVTIGGAMSLEILHLHGDFQSIAFPNPIQSHTLVLDCQNDLFHGDCDNLTFSYGGN